MRYSLVTTTNHDYNVFVSTHPHGHLFQSYEWGEVKRYSGWEPIRLSMERSGEVVAGVSLLKRTLVRGWSILYAPRGPVLDFRDEIIFNSFIRKIQRLARQEKAILLKVDPNISIQHKLIAADLKSVGFVPSSNHILPGGIQPRSSYVCTLPYPAKRQLALIIAHGKEHQLFLERATNESHVRIFYGLLLEFARMTNTHIRSYDYFATLWRQFCQSRGHLFLVKQGSTVLGGAFAIGYGSVMYNLYNVSRSDIQNLYPDTFLHAILLNWAYSHGYHYYETIDPIMFHKKKPGKDPRPWLSKLKQLNHLGEFDLPLSSKYLIYRALAPLYYWSMH